MLLGLRVRFLLGGSALAVGLLILSVLVVKRLVLFRLNPVFVLVLLACMIVLELTGLAGLVEVAKESD